MAASTDERPVVVLENVYSVGSPIQLVLTHDGFEPMRFLFQFKDHMPATHWIEVPAGAKHIVHIHPSSFPDHFQRVGGTCELMMYSVLKSTADQGPEATKAAIQEAFRQRVYILRNCDFGLYVDAMSTTEKAVACVLLCICVGWLFKAAWF